MGRSVSYPSDTLILTFATYETGEEITQDMIDADMYDQDQLGDWIDNDFAFDDVLTDLIETCKSEWPSLSEDETWLDREDHAVLSNGLVRIGISEYCGLLAYWVVARDDMTDQYGNYKDAGPLAARWAAQIEAKFIERFGTLRKCGNMSNGEGVYERIAA